MRGLTVLLAFLGVAAAYVTVPTYKDQVVADKDFLYRQKAVFELLDRVSQPNQYPDIQKYASEYNLEADFGNYNNVQAVQEFLEFYKNGYLPRGRIFSIFYRTQREEAIALFHVFYYAKNFETFYKFASWARQYMNEGMFLYSLNVAVLHRKDCQGIVLPPIYELYPYYFVNNDVIEAASRIKMQNGVLNPEYAKYYVEYKDNNYYLNANYSGWYVQYNREQRLSYFTEDIGLNAYYYYFHLDYPFWMGGEQYGLKNDRRGELYYYFYQQLLARYYLERLSNGFGEIPTFSWLSPIKTGYYPSLRYANGLDFPSRNNYYNIYNEENLYDLKDVEYYENLFMNVINGGFFTTKDGTKYFMKDPKTVDVLGMLFQENPDIMDNVNQQVYRYYEVIARVLLGASRDPINDYYVAPSALEQYETSLRDPLFWQLYKRIIRYFITYKQKVSYYTQKDLYFEGVRIENVEVDKLATYFDNYDYDITNSIYLTKEQLYNGEKYSRFYARQPRLNHKPFDVKIDVTSAGSYDAVVRVFLGPKYDTLGNQVYINDANYDFVELDYFLYKLVPGKNTITRNSRFFWRTAKDRTTSYELYKQIMGAYNGGKDFYLDSSEMHNGFPQRLILPKGTKGGYPFQLYFIISPWLAPKVEYGTGFNPIYYSGVGTGARYLDDRAFGYPFDRYIKYDSYFYQPNMFWKDVSIYHFGQDYTEGYYNFNRAYDFNKAPAANDYRKQY